MAWGCPLGADALRIMVTFAILCTAYVLSQFYRSFLAIVAPNLTQELGMGPAELGALSGIWFGAFALAQFPIGWALDTFGPRRTVAGAMIGAVVGALLVSAAQSFALMMVAMAFIGIGCAPVLMGSMFVVGRSYPPERFAILSSVVLGLGTAGVLLAATPLALAVEAFGWRISMAAIGVLTALVTLGVFVLVRDPPKAMRADAQTASAWGDLKSIISLRSLWPLMPLTFVAYAVVAAERSLWIGPYLLEVHGLDAIARGNAILAMSVAMSIGAFAYGPIERLFRDAKTTVLLGSVVTGSAFLVLGFASPGTIAAVAVLSVIGGFGLTYAILMSHARLFFPEHLLGRGVTLMNFLFISGAGLLQAASGLFVQSLASAAVPAETAFGQLHIGFGAMLLAATAIYVLAPRRPLRG
jgi:predicted MFS family arabinose efflux permease